MATLDEIAREAGVSRVTVSRVLTGKGKGVRSSALERARRIRKIAEKMGYRPNLAARAVSTGRFGSVTMVSSIDSVGIFLPEPLLRGIDDVLCEHDMHLSLARIPGSKLTSEDQLPKLIREFASDGLLLNYVANVSPIVRQIVDRFNIPCIWINTKSETDAAYPDDFRAGRQGCEFLLKLGHRRISYVSYTCSRHYSESDRRGGYEQAMKQAGLPPRSYCIPIDYHDQPYDDRLVVSRGLLTSEPRPTAVIAYAPNHALPLYEAARNLGLRVPEDLSIISFDSEHRLNITGVPFTTLAVPELALGRTSAGMLLEKINSGNPPLESKALPARLIEGNTCAPPPASTT